MKTAWHIYKKDIESVSKNGAVLITIIALCILPSLYAWINIKASWDPYSKEATSRIKVAVVNEDRGVVLQEKNINVGEKVVDGLKQNESLGWRFINKEAAMSQLRQGKIYAAIMIPEDFSRHLTSLVTHHIQEAKIQYIVNEKLNAIAPKITSKGASSIQNTVSEEVVGTVSEMVLEMAKELGIQVEQVILPKLMEASGRLHQIEDKFGEVDESLLKTQNGFEDFSLFLEKLKEYLPTVEGILDQIELMNEEIDQFITQATQGVEALTPTLKKDMLLLQAISEEINSDLESLIPLIETGSDKIPGVIENIYHKVEGMTQLTDALIGILKGLNQIGNKEFLLPLINVLQEQQGKFLTLKEGLKSLQYVIENGGEGAGTLIEKGQAILEDVIGVTTQLNESFDTKILPAIQEIFKTVHQVTWQGTQTIQGLKEAVPQTRGVIVKAQGILEKGDKDLVVVREVLPTVKEKIITLTSKIDQVNESQEIKDLIDLIKEDVKKRSTFLANATSIEEETLFPMGNYGSQMTPFYSVLAAWVGLTILVSMIAVETKEPYKSYEIYFGKLFTYLTLTLIQGIIIALGDLYLLKIYCVSPGLFLMGMLLIEVAFTVIVYSLVSVFGNIGKVIAIILMIIQVAGSGGTFPVQLTSPFFITINPYLPFTYSISYLRETIGGIEQSVFIRDIVCLVCFMMGFMLLAIMLKKHINKLLEGFVHKVHEGGL